MPEKFDIWNSFFENCDDYLRIVSQNAKRVGITDSAALVLIAVSQNKKFPFPVDNSLYSELSEKGLISMTEQPSLTSKGAILAKSFVDNFRKY